MFSTTRKTDARMSIVDAVIALAVSIVVLYIVIRYKEGLKALVHLLLAVLIWIAHIRSRAQSFLSVFPYVALFYLGADLPYILSPWYPRADTWSYHVVNFEYFAEAFRQGAGFPEWFPSAGGSGSGFPTLTPVLPCLTDYLIRSLRTYAATGLNRLQTVGSLRVLLRAWR